jgi:maltooligosyltrehalose synthase
MYNPISTYRLQFHKNFKFKDADKLVTYFDKLGVGTIYSSPVLEAVQGSVHGYNGINPHNINPEIGTRQELERLCKKLKRKQIGWLQDIVPNHMAYDTSNPWLADVLEKGRQSPFSVFFDIRWSPNEPIMAPFLGTELNNAIKEGIIKLIFKNGRLFFNVYEQNYPVNPASYNKILQGESSIIPYDRPGRSADIPQLSGSKKKNQHGNRI